jgi:hypothetical protein
VLERVPDRKPVFAGAVSLAAAGAVVAALLVNVPPHGPPAATLDSEVLFRVAVGAIFFLVFYVVAVIVRLAFYGKTPTRIGTAGTDIPDISDLRQSVEEYASLEKSLSEMEERVTELAKNLDLRIARLEKAAESAQKT